MRPIVSYDDIVAPEPPQQAAATSKIPEDSQPPAKKRKGSRNKSSRAPRHWDDPGTAVQQMAYGDSEEVIVEESRELTHEEVWDDSALIDAWNAANEEYEAYHGPDKGWKKQPVNKSPLWYNTPPANLSSKATQPSKTDINSAEVDETEPDSHPLDFNTYVPDHDPSLSLPGAVPSGDFSSSFIADPSGPMVSQDEAFQRATHAMYWTGYWTAMYHCQRRLASSSQVAAEEGEGDLDETAENDMEGDDDGDEYMDTQR